MSNAVEAPRIYATFRYRDAVKMIDWLVEAFGFAVRAKYMDGDKISHAELSLGSSMIMLGSVREDQYGALVGAPGTQSGKSIYVAVDNTDAAYERAKAAGAKIIDKPNDKDYGSREFMCAGPEGNIWSFGTYWPKTSEPAA